MNLARKASALAPRTGTSPWDGHEYGRGYAVLMLPFSSGHQLGLRVFPENDFGPYVSVWHRPPGEAWSIYVDGPSLETACPRYWGPVLDTAALTTIDVSWTGPNELRVEMEAPALSWTLSLDAPAALRWTNAVSAALPLRTWKPGPLLRLREWMARRFLGMGAIRLSFTTASGHETVLVAQENYVVEESEATFNGRPLGEPVRLEENPTVGDVLLPKVPSFVFGQAHAKITDHDEYARTRDRIRDGALERAPPE